MEGQWASGAQISTVPKRLTCQYFHYLPSLPPTKRLLNKVLFSPLDKPSTPKYDVFFGPATFLFSLETQKHWPAGWKLFCKVDLVFNFTTLELGKVIHFWEIRKLTESWGDLTNIDVLDWTGNRVQASPLTLSLPLLHRLTKCLGLRRIAEQSQENQCNLFSLLLHIPWFLSWRPQSQRVCMVLEVF